MAENKEQVCPLCRGRGAVLKDGKFKKCKCIIEKEIKSYLKPLEKYKVNKKLDISNIDKDILFYKNVKYTSFMNRVKSFLFKKFFDGEPDYLIVTGGEYTSYYVVGEERDFHYIDYLFLILGRDNYNQSLQTTMLTLLNDRKINNLKTWIYIYPNTSKSKLVDLYGEEFYEFIMDKELQKVIK